MKCTRKASVLFYGMAAALLVAGCAVKLPSSALPAFRLTPPDEAAPENSHDNSHSWQTGERSRQDRN
jgi:hypothetical protein